MDSNFAEVKSIFLSPISFLGINYWFLFQRFENSSQLIRCLLISYLEKDLVRATDSLYH